MPRVAGWLGSCTSSATFTCGPWVLNSPPIIWMKGGHSWKVSVAEWIPTNALPVGDPVDEALPVGQGQLARGAGEHDAVVAAPGPSRRHLGRELGSSVRA